ncbi:MAG: tetratricopeptide repeat protein, partial [Bacteroidota bacterium]
MPHHTYFLTLSLFFGIACFGQEKNEIDSLKSVINSSVKIEKKLDAYDALFGLLIYDDASEAFHIVNELDSIAKKENHLPGIILSNLNLGYYYYVEEVIDSAEFYLNKTLDLSKKNYSEDIVLTALNNLSLVEAHKGNYVASNSILDSLGTIYLKNKNYLRYGVSINNIAANNYDQGNYLEAMEGYQHALKILDTIKEEPFRKADVLRNIGKLNIRQNHLEEALEYFSSALKIYLDVGDNLYAASTYLDIGTVHSDLENYEKAIEYHKKGLELGEKNNQGSISVLANGNIGIVYLQMKKFQEAIRYLKKGLHHGGSELSDINKTIYLYQIGNSYTNIGSYDIAKKYLDSSVILAQNNKIGNELLNALSYRSFNYELMGDLKNAIADIKE